MKLFFTIFFFCFIAFTLGAQTQVRGQVTTDKGVALPNAKVTFYQNRVYIAAAYTDQFGKYYLNEIDPGKYDVSFEAQGLQNQFISQFIVFAGRINKLDAELHTWF